jgi:uncharacterized membrane protein (UPF0127 family)
MKKLAFLGILFVALFTGFMLDKQPLKVNAVIEGENYILEVVDTAAKREQGLSNRPILEENTGMLFLFEQSDYHGIWMKDMNFAIDILWLTRENQVIHIMNSVQPDTYPEVFLPPKKAQKIIELPAGTIKNPQNFVNSVLFIDK